MEKVRAVATHQFDQVVHEGGGLGAQALAWRVALKLGQKVPQLGLSHGSVLRPVSTIRGGAEVVGYVSEMLHMALYPARNADLMPVRRERLCERIEAGGGHRRALRVFFWVACSTVLRTCSRH